MAIKQATATRGRRPTVSPAAATICGEGVSPAANAAASGSPPGKAAATLSTFAGRAEASVSRQRRITFSTIGSRSFTTDDGLLGPGRLGVLPSRSLAGADDFSVKARFPVKTSYNTRPNE